MYNHQHVPCVPLTYIESNLGSSQTKGTGIQTCCGCGNMGGGQSFAHRIINYQGYSKFLYKVNVIEKITTYLIQVFAVVKTKN